MDVPRPHVLAMRARREGVVPLGLGERVPGVGGCEKVGSSWRARFKCGAILELVASADTGWRIGVTDAGTWNTN